MEYFFNWCSPYVLEDQFELQYSLGWNGALEDILLQQDIKLPF